MTTQQARFPWFEDLFHAIDTACWKDLPAFFHTDVVYERPGYAPIHGLNALLDFYSGTRIIARGKHSLDGGLREVGSAICWGHFNGVSKDGATLAERFADAYVLEGGLIRKRTTFFFRAAI